PVDFEFIYIIQVNPRCLQLEVTTDYLIKGRREFYQEICYFMEALGRKYGNDENKIQNGIYKKINEMESAKEYEQFIGVWLFFLRRRVRGARKK
ncbi:MAG: hypothetical protein J5904_05425, partial [Anaerovibrio sp.]|nr:hypothetical protein [Anaerovibrio sp.]